jgi:hypothetical protein
MGNKRSPGRHRDLHEVGVIYPPQNANLNAIAEEAWYGGASYHKKTPSFAGPPGWRPGKTACPSRFKDQQDMLTGWIKEAIRRGVVSEEFQGDFPAVVWYLDTERDEVYRAELTQRTTGEYHGYPIKHPPRVHRDDERRSIQDFFD